MDWITTGYISSRYTTCRSGSAHNGLSGSEASNITRVLSWSVRRNSAGSVGLAAPGRRSGQQFHQRERAVPARRDEVVLPVQGADRRVDADAGVGDAVRLAQV